MGADLRQRKTCFIPPRLTHRLGYSKKASMDFILNILDSQTGCIIAVFPINTQRMGEIAEVLTIQDYDPNAIYDLEKTDINKLGLQYSLDLNGSEEQGYLRPRLWLDDLSYRVHTGRELLLMREGLKPLAVFAEWDSSVEEAYFAPYVEQGLFVKQVYETTGPSAIKLTLYALPDEAWRIQAYILMHRIASKTGWNEALERMEGLLLGYTEWQNDEFIHLRKANSPHTFQQVQSRSDD